MPPKIGANRFHTATTAIEPKNSATLVTTTTPLGANLMSRRLPTLKLCVVLIQYPMYAGIVEMLTRSGLAEDLSRFFVAIANEHTYPVLVGIYSAFLGLFIPSAGGKWLIEAPYLLDAAIDLEVHLGWVVQTYNATEALANLIHPFWMLPLVGILGLKARDIVGYSMLQFVVHVPLVLFLVWILNYTLTYVAPVLP